MHNNIPTGQMAITIRDQSRYSRDTDELGKIGNMKKPTLHDLMRKLQQQHGIEITRQGLAQRSGLSYAEVYVVAIGGYIAEDKVRQTLRAFNELSGLELALKDIQYRKIAR